MSCKTCINYGIYEMITSGKPYGYGGDIPCNRCSRYRKFEDLYMPLSKPSVVSVPSIRKIAKLICNCNDKNCYSIGVAEKIHKLIMKGEPK